MSAPTDTTRTRVSTAALTKVGVHTVDIDPDVLEAAFETAHASPFPDDHPAVVLLRESISGAPERLDPRTGKPMSRIGAARALVPGDGETPETVVTMLERAAATIGLGKPLTQIKPTPNGVLVLFKARTKVVGGGRRKDTTATPANGPAKPRARR